MRWKLCVVDRHDVLADPVCVVTVEGPVPRVQDVIRFQYGQDDREFRGTCSAVEHRVRGKKSSVEVHVLLWTEDSVRWREVRRE